jgi:hypothetical protein
MICIATACGTPWVRGYYVDNGTVRYSGGIDGGTHPVDGADAATLRIIDAYYAQDRSHVYYSGGRISGADPQSFEVFHDDVAGDMYARDHNHVFFAGKMVPGADAPSFKLFPAEYYAADRSNVFYQKEIIPNADPTSFESIPGSDPGRVFARDRSHVFYDREVIADANPRSFEVVDGPDQLGKDDSHVWRGTRQISDDPTHFEVMLRGRDSVGVDIFVRDQDMGPSLSDEHAIAKDSRTVFCNGDLLSNDPTHFVIVRYPRDNGNAQYMLDHEAVYWACQRVPGADPRTLHLLEDTNGSGAYCAADANHAYWRGRLIPGQSPQSFPQGRKVTSCDATGVTFGS